MKKVLLGQKIHEDSIKLLKDNAVEVIISPSPDAEVVKKYIKDADGIIVRTSTKLSRETIFAANKLKVIGRTGVGVDNVDIEAASEKNIPVCNTPEANTQTVAEHTVSFILALAKGLRIVDRAVREGNWKIRHDYITIDISKKTLGLVGFGKIGKATAKKCYDAFSMNIIAYDPFLPENVEVDFHYKLLDRLEEIFEQSDFVSLHMPHTKENHHLINKNLLLKMKNKAYLINTSRGGMVDEQALAEIISEGRIAGAALDVFEDEPPEKDNPLLGLEEVILSPHSAALTKESSRRMAMHAAEGVLDVLEGRKPKWVYNRNKIKLSN